MADNLGYTPGAGATVAADDVSSVFYQRIKVDGGGDGLAVPILAGNGVAASALRVTLASDGTGVVAATQSGTWNVTNVSGTVSLPTGAATAAKQPALGTAGTASADVISVQGIASMTPLLVTPTTNAPFNIAQINGVTPLMGNGATGTGALRVSIASDSTGIVALTTGSAQIGHLEANQSSNVAQINGVTPLMGNGASGTGAQRVTLANDSTGIVALTTGSAQIGHLEANQSSNVAQINGVTVLMGNGASGTGAQRVTIANDSTGILAGVTTVSTVSAVTAVGTITPGVAATSLGKAEDAVHASGDVGVMALAVRQDANAALAADGDYTPLQTDATGYLKVNVVTGGGSGGTALADDAAFTVGVTNFTPAGGTYRSVRDSVDDNDGGAFAMNQKRGMYATLETPAADSVCDDTLDTVKVSQATAANLNATVSIAAAQTLATVTTVSTVTTCSTLTGGAVADDGADSGNPVKVGAKALKNPATATMVADADRTDLSSDLDKAVRVKGWTTGADLISASQSVTDTTSTAVTNFGAVASTKNFVTSVTVHNAHATTNGFMKLQDGSGGTTIWVFPLPATGGTTHNFDPPLKQPTANTALYFASSASITTIYISVNGFQSKCY